VCDDFCTTAYPVACGHDLLAEMASYGPYLSYDSDGLLDRYRDLDYLSE
jgi:hypothetical protein